MKASESCRPSAEETNSITGALASLTPSEARAYAVIEKVDRHIQDARDLEQAPGADPVDAFFVFLHLLEGEPQKIAQFFLAHADQHAPDAHPIADLSIYGVGFFWSSPDVRREISGPIMERKELILR